MFRLDRCRLFKFPGQCTGVALTNITLFSILFGHGFNNTCLPGSGLPVIEIKHGSGERLLAMIRACRRFCPNSHDKTPCKNIRIFLKEKRAGKSAPVPAKEQCVYLHFSALPTSDCTAGSLPRARREQQRQFFIRLRMISPIALSFHFTDNGR